MQFDDHIFQMDLNHQLDHVWILPGQYPVIFKYSSENDGLMWVSKLFSGFPEMEKRLSLDCHPKKGPHLGGGFKHVFFQFNPTWGNDHWSKLTTLFPHRLKPPGSHEPEVPRLQKVSFQKFQVRKAAIFPVDEK